MSIRFAASVAAAALLCACSGSRSASSGPDAVSRSPAPAAASAAAVPGGPPNAPVPRAGAAGAIPLDPAQRRQLDASVAALPATVRPRLRYALATGDDGRRRLVVYDGEGLGVTGRHAGKPHDYVVFRVLNSPRGEHYDPQQNSIIAPIPPPPQREGAIKP